MVNDNHGRKKTELLSAFFALDRYCKVRPEDPNALHLFALVSELLGQKEEALGLLQRSLSILESVYEETENATVERQFCIAMANIARLRLATSDYTAADEAFQTVVGLISESPDDDVVVVLRVQALFGSGFAQFKMGNLEEAVELLQSAVEAAVEVPLIRSQVEVLLAQVLWALNTNESRESAKNQLLGWYVLLTALEIIDHR